MPRVQIRNYRTGELITEGLFKTVRDCLEQASKDNVCLDYADLRHCNLSNACLDDLKMRHAKLDYANLNGANLSESVLDGTTMSHASFYGTCLGFSSLLECDFREAEFGATDIAGSDISGSMFSTQSALALNFIDTDRMVNCVFRSDDNNHSIFSRPPVYISGLPLPIVFLEQHVKIAEHLKHYKEWLQNDSKLPKTRKNNEGYAHNFFCKHRKLITSFVENGSDASQCSV